MTDEHKKLLLVVLGVSVAAHLLKRPATARTNGGAPDHCPYSTLDLRLNTKNRNYAAREFHYGPLNPNEANTEYWRSLAAVFKPKGEAPTAEDIRGAKRALCGNCGVFDISPRMQKCLPPLNNADEYDRFAVESGSVLGYCWAHHFKCASLRTCETWVVGGPLRTDDRSEKMSRRYGRGPTTPIGTPAGGV